jgi:hypothetical protein
MLLSAAIGADISRATVGNALRSTVQTNTRSKTPLVRERAELKNT